MTLWCIGEFLFSLMIKMSFQQSDFIDAIFKTLKMTAEALLTEKETDIEMNH
jgi:hypothetical protein